MIKNEGGGNEERRRKKSASLPTFIDMTAKGRKNDNKDSIQTHRRGKKPPLFSSLSRTTNEKTRHATTTTVQLPFKHIFITYSSLIHSFFVIMVKKKNWIDR